MRLGIFLVFYLVFMMSMFMACSDDSSSQNEADGDTEVEQTEQEQETETVSCNQEKCTDDFGCSAGCICLDGKCEDGKEVRYDLKTTDSRLIYRNDKGSFDVFDSSGNIILSGATAKMMIGSAGEDGNAFLLSKIKDRKVEVKSDDTDERLGKTSRLVITATNQEHKIEIIWTISAYEDGYYTILLELNNQGEKEQKLAKISPVIASGDWGGALFLGDDPKNHRIWENGRYSYVDFFADVVPGDTKPDPIFELINGIIPGSFEGYSPSNITHGMKDLESGKIWIAGALTTNTSSPIMSLSYDEAKSEMADDGRKGFSFFSGEAIYQPKSKPVAAGVKQASELYYFHPTETNIFEGMERWAQTVKKQNQIVLWTEKKEGNRIPNGWNSWTTSGSTGGYGTGIDEQIILDNLEVMATEFRDWGMDWYQIDDGYEPHYGDWWWVKDKFPNGARYLSDKIREKGLKPGLWMAPFTHHNDSQVFKDNPDWFAGTSDVGGIFNGGYQLLDLTHPEVKKYLHDLFKKFKQDWKYDWLKMDFSYWALMGDDFHDSTKTREEAYRDALKIIREEIGDDTFFLAVSAIGAHLGLVDSDRLTLDNMPVWDIQPEDTETAKMTQQGFKPTIRTAARRYFLHNNIWVNHSDLIVFRENTSDTTGKWIPTTLEEVQAFCTYVGLTGGIVKIGDKLVWLQKDHINTIRKLLPIYGKGSRPLDLMEREFPEFWHMKVDSSLDGYDEKYNIIGLFNWGSNWDYTVNPYKKIEDGDTRSFNVDLGGIGLDTEKEYLAYEFWTEKFIGVVQKSLSYEVKPHLGRAIALREKSGKPQFLGWNRQITMGATDIKSIVWDDSSNKIVISTKVAKPTDKAPFTYKMSFYIPDGYAVGNVEYGGDSVTDTKKTEENNELVLEFIPSKTGEITITIEFSN